MDSRTTGAINLGPTGNVQGTHKFLSLKTGDWGEEIGLSCQFQMM
jgi:hypothetical protein